MYKSSLRHRRPLLIVIICSLVIVSGYFLALENKLGGLDVPWSWGSAFIRPQDKTKTSRWTHTTIPHNAHSPGFTVFDELYLRNGVLYVLTPYLSKFPPRHNLISKPQVMGQNDLTPTDQELRFIGPQERTIFLGNHYVRIDGVTVIPYDPNQFMIHYYHWWGELMFGFWRIYSKLAGKTFVGGSVWSLPFPTRFIVPNVSNGGWRDDNRGRIDGPLMRAAFPQALVEDGDWWQDIISLNVTIQFERVVLMNRHAAHQHPSATQMNKMIAGLIDADVPHGFWEPIRQSVLNNFLGHIPSSKAGKPLVTYISRQGGDKRRLSEADHLALVEALKTLEAEDLCDVVVVRMEELNLGEQVELAARSMVLLGVHGNGLTHELWMPSTARSAIIEIFFPQGYMFDYEILARNLGHKHYAIWNDTVITYPKGMHHETFNEPGGFHGSEIPVHAPTVVKLINERLRS